MKLKFNVIEFRRKRKKKYYWSHPTNLVLLNFRRLINSAIDTEITFPFSLLQNERDNIQFNTFFYTESLQSNTIPICKLFYVHVRQRGGLRYVIDGTLWNPACTREPEDSLSIARNKWRTLRSKFNDPSAGIHGWSIIHNSPKCLRIPINIRSNSKLVHSR